MKRNKLSALEKMRIRRSRLKAEEQKRLSELDKHINFLQSHWGTLLINSGIDAIKSRVYSLAQPFFGNKIESQKCSTENSADGFLQKYPYIITVADRLIDILPLFLKAPKSTITVIILKSIKDLFLNKNQNS